jgi:hypothetical protein
MEFKVKKFTSSPGIVFHQHHLTRKIKFHSFSYRKHAREDGGFQPARGVLKTSVCRTWAQRYRVVIGLFVAN